MSVFSRALAVIMMAAACALPCTAAVAAVADGLKVDTRTIQSKTAAYEIDCAYPQPGVKAIDDGAKGLPRISALATADLTRRLTTPELQADPDEIKRGAGPDWANFKTFLLLSDALKIIFLPYPVAAYVFGIQETRIPLSALGAVMRAEVRAPAASFDCADTAMPVERAICFDAALARLDRETAAAYAGRLVDAAKPVDKEAVRTRQRSWLSTAISRARISQKRHSSPV